MWLEPRAATYFEQFAALRIGRRNLELERPDDLVLLRTIPMQLQRLNPTSCSPKTAKTMPFLRGESLRTLNRAIWFALALSVQSVSATAPHAKPFERFDGCKLEPDEWTDGDSLRVRLPDGRLETFRLYYVDTTELVRNGLARIYGTRTPAPDGRDSRQYRAKLTELENQAKVGEERRVAVR